MLLRSSYYYIYYKRHHATSRKRGIFNLSVLSAAEGNTTLVVLEQEKSGTDTRSVD